MGSAWSRRCILSGTSTSHRSDGSPDPRSDRLKRWVGAPLAAAGLAAASIVITASPVFRAKTIEVVGNHRLPDARIIREAGLHRGTNVFWFHGSTAERRLGRDPWLASASVSRRLPSTIRIAVKERHPASRVQVGSTWLLVATDGVVLGFTTHPPPVPSLPAAGSLRLGGRSPDLAAPARVAAGLDPWVRSRVASLHPSGDGELVLELSSGTRVLFGRPTDVLAKDRALAGIMRWAAHRGKRFRYVDLRAP